MGTSSPMESGASFNSAVDLAILLPDAEGGVELANVPAGMTLEIETKNHCYRIIPQKTGGFLIWGHPELCPEPILVEAVGSTPGGYLQREGYVCPGLYLTFRLPAHTIKTSRILSVSAKRRQ